MSRIQPLTPPFPPEIQTEFDAIMRGAPPLMLFKVLAVEPRAWRKFCAGGLLDPGPLSLRDREIVINRTCAMSGCEYEWGVHVAIFAEAAGLTEEEIEATVPGGAQAACWSAAEQALIAATDALHLRATLDQAEFDNLRRHYNDAQILEVLLLCGYYRTVSYVANALAMPLEPNASRFPANRMSSS